MWTCGSGEVNGDDRNVLNSVYMATVEEVGSQNLAKGDIGLLPVQPLVLSQKIGMICRLQ